MSHIPPLISDLALILITAGAITILFKWLKQPVVLGYIVAGFLISPHFYFLFNVADLENIKIWAEIGIIFLLFALGLEFSFKKLIDVGGKATIATLINLGAMFLVGYAIGQLMGWTQMESLFLGGMISMSSTTIIIKAFNDMGLQKKRFAGIVFGMLIVEDLAAILMMVLFSTMAVSKHFEGTELFQNSLKLIFFIVIWFVVGIVLLPSLLKRFRKFLNDEMLLIVSVGLCLGMVLFSDSVGLSVALGAFVMGSILSETIESKHIEHLVEPLKNLFGAVFFVSVGMMLSPQIFADHAWTILILTVVVLVGRVIFATLGVLAAGEGLKVSLQSGFSLAQIGEFSFIIATLGLQLGVISEFIYPVIVAVSIITTFTTPYFIKLSNPLYNRLEKIVPTKWDRLITGIITTKEINQQSAWKKVWKNSLLNLFVFSLLAAAMLILSRQYIIPFITDEIPTIWGAVLSATVTLLLMSPFLIGAIIPRKNLRKEYISLINDKHFYKGMLLLLNMFKLATCVGLILMVLVPLFPNASTVLILLAIPILLLLFFIQKRGKRPERLVAVFLRNLNAKEHLEEQGKVVKKQVKNDLLSKNIHIKKVEIPQNSSIAGRTLSELNFKRTAGVSVVSIVRGEQRMNIPDSNEPIFPLDKLVVAGLDEEIQRFMQLIQVEKPTSPKTDILAQIMLEHYMVEEGSFMIGYSIKDLKIREKTSCIIICIDRNEETISDIQSDFVFQQDDVLWLAGEEKQLNRFEMNLFND